MSASSLLAVGGLTPQGIVRPWWRGGGEGVRCLRIRILPPPGGGGGGALRTALMRPLDRRANRLDTGEKAKSGDRFVSILRTLEDGPRPPWLPRYPGKPFHPYFFESFESEWVTVPPPEPAKGEVPDRLVSGWSGGRGTRGVGGGNVPAVVLGIIPPSRFLIRPPIQPSRSARVIMM